LSDREESDRGLARARRSGILPLPLPTPFAVGRVNAYLIEDEPLTLVDAGPNSGTTLEALEQALRAHGHRLDEIELLLITHQHIDHFGLASIIAGRSGAEVAALDVLAPYLGDFRAEAIREDEYAAATMLRHGVPADYAKALRTVAGSFRGWGAPVEVTRPLPDGSELSLRDRTFRVLRRPGHSPSDTILYDAEQRLLIAGDHLLKAISSNALVTRMLPGDEAAPTTGPKHLDGRPASLLVYNDSLRATAAMDVEFVLSGHGPIFDGHSQLVEERLAMQRRRASKIAALISSRDLTAHEIALQMWGDVAVTQTYLTLSEVLGHLDLLLEDGGAAESEDGEVIRFTAAG
jgi:glyoxylase-like metal-dependent hydrolase (beta-lactamase superfamily II)